MLPVYGRSRDPLSPPGPRGCRRTMHRLREQHFYKALERRSVGCPQPPHRGGPGTPEHSQVPASSSHGGAHGLGRCLLAGLSPGWPSPWRVTGRRHSSGHRVPSLQRGPNSTRPSCVSPSQQILLLGMLCCNTFPQAAWSICTDVLKEHCLFIQRFESRPPACNNFHSFL